MVVRDKRHVRREQQTDALVQGARARFLAGERIDLAAIAAEQGITRSTAYRWLGSSDRLLAEALWSLTYDAFGAARHQAQGAGRDAVLATFRRFCRYSLESEAVQCFLNRDPKVAMAVLTTREFPVQARFITMIEHYLAEVSETGALQLPSDVHTVAYAVARLVEAFLYADVVAGEKPDLDNAVKIIGLLLPAGAVTTDPEDTTTKGDGRQ